jgi:hypothetical protein
MLINKAWLSGAAAARRRSRPPHGWAMTFTGFAIGGVFFRAADIGAAWHLLTAMAGLGNAPVPQLLVLPHDNWGINHGFISEEFVRTWLGSTWSVIGTLVTLAALLVALFVPDTMEIADYREGDAQSNWRRSLVVWQPSLVWCALVASTAVAWTGLDQPGAGILYYQF